MKNQLIETQNVTRDYGFVGTIAIIDTPKGRVLIADGFGGIDTVAGGAVRWRHGKAVQLQAGDTIESLENEMWNDSMTQLDAVQAGCDPERPLLIWDGRAVAMAAGSVGLWNFSRKSPASRSRRGWLNRDQAFQSAPKMSDAKKQPHKDRRVNNGGARKGAGRKPATQKRVTASVSMLPDGRKELWLEPKQEKKLFLLESRQPAFVC